jgi:hypothetical protein
MLETVQSGEFVFTRQSRKSMEQLEYAYEIGYYLLALRDEITIN